MEHKKGNTLIFVLIVIVLIGIVLFFYLRSNKTYTVTFDTNGGGKVIEQKIKKGEMVVKPNDPIKEGYIFIEWDYKGTIFDFTTKVDKDIVLEAVWKQKEKGKETYVVKFDTDGGSTISNQIINKGETIKKPNDPTKEGYKFVNWYNKDTIYNFSLKVYKDLVLTAKWEKVEEKPEETKKPTTNTPKPSTAPTKKEYTITFDSNGGSGIQSKIVTEGIKVSKPNEPKRNGYKFICWTLNGNEYDFNKTVNQNITLVAKWEKIVKKVYTIKFNSNGGSNINEQVVDEGNKVSKPNNPTRNGYKYVGWTLEGKEYDFNSSVNRDITLVAKWEEIIKNKYTIKFNSNGGSNINDQVVEEGSKVSKPSNPIRNGYKFICWTLNGSEYDFNKTVNQNITLVAKWTQKNYTVKVSIVDDYSPARVLTTYEEGKKIIVKNIYYTDGTFICTGINANVNKNALVGETKLQLELDDGTKVIATIIE